LDGRGRGQPAIDLGECAGRLHCENRAGTVEVAQ
jgi:hypothetical protein